MTTRNAHDNVPVREPIISVRDAGVEFNRGRRNKGLRELIFRRETGRESQAFWALRNVSFDVDAGEAIGVVGRNGQGKSTLLKLVAGVMLPDEGAVQVQAPVAPLIEITGAFVPDLTGRENIYLAAGLYGMSRATIDSRFDEIVDFAEIENFLDTPYRHYSSGMKVRLAFSVISSIDRPVLLVDEVLAVGDKAFRNKCYKRIDALLAQGRTLFLVSHSESDLTRFCDRGLYLQGGELQADGPIEDILAEYAKEAAA